MPGDVVMRRVLWLAVGLAVALLVWGPAMPAGAGTGALSGISSWQSTPAPWSASPWSRRQAANSPSETQPANKRCYPQGGFQGLVKLLAGGLLGGLLCSFIFGCPLSLYWDQGGVPVGFLDVVVLTSVAYLGYRLLRPAPRREGGILLPGFSHPGSLAPPVFTIRNEAGPGLVQISRTDPAFNLVAFVDQARQMIFDLHDVWNQRDLDGLKDRITPQMMEFLGMGLKLLGLRGEISRVEDLALSQIVVVMAGQKEDRERIAVSFQGRVVDYLLETRSLKLVSGSMTYPERLHECWIYERQLGRGPWLLADIQDYRLFWENEAA